MPLDILTRSVSVGAPGVDSVRAYAVTTEPFQVVVAPELAGAFVRFLARGGDVQIAFNWGLTGVDLVFDGTPRGSTVQAGVPEQFILPDRPRGLGPDVALWLSAVAETTATIEYYSTEGWRAVR